MTFEARGKRSAPRCAYRAVVAKFCGYGTRHEQAARLEFDLSTVKDPVANKPKSEEVGTLRDWR
jgi:hypothetical protein